MRSSTITPAPPGSACACRAGVGLTTSKIRNSTKARTATGTVSGTRSTESVIPATSSMTIAPGSLLPSARSACSAAQVPISVTTTNTTTRPVGENDSSQSARIVSALATVPGATGAQPTPPRVAMATATRVVAGTPSLRSAGDELVAFHLDDSRAREAARHEGGTIAQIDDTVDLGRLTGRAAFPRKRGILARTVHEHVHDAADELGIAVESHRIVLVLHDAGAIRSDLRIDLIRKRRRRRAAFW